MVIQLSKDRSARLLKHVVRCYFRLSDNPRAREALRQCLPDQLKDQTFAVCLRDDPSTKRWLSQLLKNLEQPVMPPQWRPLSDTPSVTPPQWHHMDSHAPSVHSTLLTLTPLQCVILSDTDRLVYSETVHLISIGKMLLILTNRFHCICECM